MFICDVLKKHQMINNTVVLQQLEKKFQGVRADSLAHVAAFIATMAADENDAVALIEKLTEEGVNAIAKSHQSEIDKRVTDATTTRERKLREEFEQWKKENNLSGGSGSGSGNGGNGDNGNNQDVAKMIEDAVARATASLQQGLTTLQTEKITDARRAQLTSILNDLPEQYTKAVMNGFTYRQFKDDEEFNSYLTETKTDADNYRQTIADANLRAGHGAAFLGGKNADGVSNAVESLIKQRESAENNTNGKSLM